MATGLKVFPIVVMGATGVGKSKLAIEIAQRFNGEVINADSMQIYKGLDIVTNKVTAEERELVPHHLMDYVDPFQTNHTIVDYRNEAIPVIDDLLKKGKTPVICGGTMYYIESLVWDTLVSKHEFGNGEDPVEGNSRKPTSKELNKLNGHELHEKLKSCDPETAARYHPNNKRKILRALEVFEKYGKPLSEYLKDQQKGGKSQLRGPMRYPDVVMMWVESEAKVLNDRLDRRVDQMIESGMLREMLDFHDKFNRLRVESETIGSDYSFGIFQSIGFKEFHTYLTMSDSCKESPLGKKAFQEGLNHLKLHTKQYTRSQRNWINNRFLKKTTEEEPIPPIYKLDSTNVNIWNENVRDKAYEVLEHLRNQQQTTPVCALHAEEVFLKTRGKREEILECKNCGKFFENDAQLEKHLKGKKHKQTLESLKTEHLNLSQTLVAIVNSDSRDETKLQSEPVKCKPCKRSFSCVDKLNSHVLSKKHKRKEQQFEVQYDSDSDSEEFVAKEGKC